MEKIKTQEFLKLLNDVSIFEIEKENKTFWLEKNFDFKIDKNGTFELKVNSYSLSNKETGKKKTIKSIEKLVKYLTKNLFIVDDIITIKTINDRFKTTKEYYEDLAFNNISMQGLLEQFSSCDTFSLSTRYNDEFSSEFPNGIYHLDKELGDKAIKKEETRCTREAKKIYEMVLKEEPNLPPFEVVYNDMKQEKENLEKKIANNELKEDESPFICDWHGKHKYSNDKFYNAYSSFDFLFDIKKSVEDMNKNTKTRELDQELDNEEYKELKPYLKNIEATFSSHCTISGTLTKIFYFELNNETKKWLLNFQDDYKLEGLEDLAFYENGKLKFSSCTHERYHNKFE